MHLTAKLITLADFPYGEHIKAAELPEAATHLVVLNVRVTSGYIWIPLVRSNDFYYRLISKGGTISSTEMIKKEDIFVRQPSERLPFELKISRKDVELTLQSKDCNVEIARTFAPVPDSFLDVQKINQRCLRFRRHGVDFGFTLSVNVSTESMRRCQTNLKFKFDFSKFFSRPLHSVYGERHVLAFNSFHVTNSDRLLLRPFDGDGDGFSIEELEVSLRPLPVSRLNNRIGELPSASFRYQLHFEYRAQGSHQDTSE